MTTNLTKQEAHLIAGNGYRLVDAGGRQCLVVGAIEDIFTVRDVLPIGQVSPYKEAIKISDIGVTHWIACHPLSRLTTEIEGIGVPIVELANMVKKTEWEITTEVSVTSYDHYFQFSYEGGFFTLLNAALDGILFDTKPIDKQLEAWNFDTMQLIERGIGKEINLK